MNNEAADLSRKIVCVLPKDFALTEEAWQLIYGEWRTRGCNRGCVEPLSADEVTALFNR